MTHPFPTRRSSDLRRSRPAPTRSTASTRSRTTSPTTGPSDMAGGRRVLVIGPEPTSWSEWAADLVVHGPVLVALARKDFQTRYKRASFGVLWAVVLPVVQALVLAVVFSKIARFDTGGWSYKIGRAHV